MPLSPRSAPSSPPRVVIVDADRRVQQSISDLLGVTGEVEVVGRAGDVRTALEEVQRLRPDVVLVDTRLPDVEAGEALIGGLSRAWPSMRIVLTGWSNPDGQARPGEVANCYVSKGSSPEEFIAAIVDACCVD